MIWCDRVKGDATTAVCAPPPAPRLLVSSKKRPASYRGRELLALHFAMTMVLSVDESQPPRMSQTHFCAFIILHNSAFVVRESDFSSVLYVEASSRGRGGDQRAYFHVLNGAEGAEQEEEAAPPPRAYAR